GPARYGRNLGIRAGSARAAIDAGGLLCIIPGHLVGPGGIGEAGLGGHERERSRARSATAQAVAKRRIEERARAGPGLRPLHRNLAGGAGGQHIHIGDLGRAAAQRNARLIGNNASTTRRRRKIGINPVRIRAAPHQASAAVGIVISRHVGRHAGNERVARASRDTRFAGTRRVGKAALAAVNPEGRQQRAHAGSLAAIRVPGQQDSSTAIGGSLQVGRGRPNYRNAPGFLVNQGRVGRATGRSILCFKHHQIRQRCHVGAVGRPPERAYRAGRPLRTLRKRARG
nr:hypothetical protein [Tanacetum cinerariifolium]